MSSIPLRSGVLVAILYCSAEPVDLVAQRPRQPPPPPTTAPDADLLASLRAPIHDEPGPDGRNETWTAGRDWKASLHDGLCFHARPATPEQPSAPWRWRTVSVRAGGEDLALHEPRRRIANDFRCEFDLGPVIEAYDVRSNGLEQSFVLARPIAGDLVLTGAVETGLAGAPTAAKHGELLFTDGRGASVLRYGAAFAIDRDGRRLPIGTGYHDGRITLHVPGAWLADASWPVVIDPLLSSAVVHGSSGGDCSRIVVERDDRNTSGNVGFAIERAFASGDTDLWFVLANDDLLGASTVFSRVGAGTSSSADLCFVAGANRWVLSWDSFDYSDLRERSVYLLHPGGSTTASNTVYWAPRNGSRRQRTVRLGGSRWSAAPGTEALLVWESEPVATSGNTAATQLWAAVLDCATNIAGAPFHLAGNTASFPGDSEGPSVSKDRGIGSWVVAWQHLTGFPSRWNVAAQRIASSGQIASGAFHTDRAGGSEHLIGPVVDGRHGEYLIAFQTVPIGGDLPVGAAGQTVRTQRFRWQDGAGFPTPLGPSMRVIGPANYRAFTADAVAHDTVTGSHWALTTSQDFLGTPIAMLTVLGHDAAPRENALVLSNQQSRASGVTFDDDRQQFVTVCGELQSGVSRAKAQRFQYPGRAAPATFGIGCSTAGISATGTFLAGDARQTIRLAAAPSGVFALLALSAGPANMPLDGHGLPGCTLLVDPTSSAWLGAEGFVTSGIGAAELALALPSRLVDADLHCQWMHLTAAGDRFVATRGLRAQIR